MKLTIAIIASILAIIGNIPYLTDVIKRRVEPHPYTWFIWSIVSAITFFGLLAKGGGIGAIPTGVAELFTIVIFFVALERGFGKGLKEGLKHVTLTDNIFLIVSLLGLIPWILTNDPTISVITVVSVDVIAFLPTLRKTWKHPKTETPLLYSMNVSRHVLTLFTLGAYNIATTLHSIAMIVTNSLMTIFILTKKLRNK